MVSPVKELRLRQSYSGYLLGRNGKTLLELRRDIARGRVPTKAMEEGSLMDQLLFGGGNFQELGECTKRSGPNKGETFMPEDYSTKDAQEQRDRIRARGMIPVLASEVAEALEQAQGVRETLLRHGIDLYREHTKCLGEPIGERIDRLYTQPLVQWPGRHGTLDILEIQAGCTWRIIDTKLSQRCDEEWVQSQAAKMGWDVQAGAYYEACVEGLGLDPAKFGGYGLCVCEKRSGLSMSAMHWLTPMYLECGKALWERCKTVWGQALASDEWPGALDTAKLEPPGFHVSRIFDKVDSSGAEDLSEIGLDMTGIEMIANG
jgi:hypothetical protein